MEEIGRTEGVGGELVDRLHGLSRARRPVWVLLDRLVHRGPGQPQHLNAAGIDLSGRAPGLMARWVPTYQGDWLGVVTYPIRFADGRPPLWVHDQLVPSYALEERPTTDDFPGTWIATPP
ncbi:hypothetical protein L6E12_27075 [Actinokineospora sp. PR83]|uniref:hypothetical protein n=1 Tax=Actinokineospora sp. PR83 TaxID=2884908 RepID=UPI001F41B019|nr:hypothetical protein [Actinokineospora sp. PR83]MCG8919444.1 hypothetical protein [Actinokineospora sp. PR83]